MLKEVEVHGKPGNICAIYRINPDYGDEMPTKGLAWGAFGDDGIFTCTLNTDEQEKVQIREYEPQVASFLEKHWHINTES